LTFTTLNALFSGKSTTQKQKRAPKKMSAFLLPILVFVAQASRSFQAREKIRNKQKIKNGWCSIHFLKHGALRATCFGF